MSEHSLLNASPETIAETTDEYSPRPVPLHSVIPSASSESPYTKQFLRKRERIAFRLDSIADCIWDTSSVLLQLKTRGKGWTAEVYSYVFVVLSFLGLVATLFAHQNKPLPEWPQLVSINSIVSLFSLLIRASIAFVLAEGMSSYLMYLNMSLRSSRHKSVQVAVVPKDAKT